METENPYSVIFAGFAEPRTSNLEPRTSNLEPRTSNLEPRTSNLKQPVQLRIYLIYNHPQMLWVFGEVDIVDVDD